MKKKNNIWIYPLLILGFVLFFINGCKKEETKNDPVITWENPADISFGTLLSEIQLNATADVPGTFVYTPLIGTQLDVGTNQDLKVDFTPTDGANYNTVSKTVKINVVAKKDPIITWSNPADIVSGTLLSITQLNATADVPGTFFYTPAIGAVLNEGNYQDLKVDFTPANAAIYNASSETVKINVISSTITDIEGNIYKIVTIGGQTWMAENLKTTKYNDNTVIPLWNNLSNTPGYCWYNNNEVTFKATYGAIYNWYTVNTGKLCPTGWHVPTDAEWTTMENYLIANGYNYDGTTTGDRDSNNLIAKALASATGWRSSSSNEGAVGYTDYPAKRNVTGFTALPGGYRGSDGTFDYIGMYGLWWSATEYSTSSAWERSLHYFYSYVFRSSLNKSMGFSVRCLRD